MKTGKSSSKEQKVYSMKQEEKEFLEEETFSQETADRSKGVKLGIAVFLAVLLIFAGILVITGALGSVFGKAAENIALGVVAVILVFLLIKSKRS